MDKKVLNTLFIIASLGLIIAEVIFLCFSIFDGEESSTPLLVAIGCLGLSNLFLILRCLNNKNN